MTDFYNAGKYWPDPSCEIASTFDGGLQGLEVITIKPDEMFEDDSSHRDTFDRVEYIFKDQDDGEDSNSSSSHDKPQYTAGRLFTDELELLLTNVDGDDSDPDVIAVPGPRPLAGRQSRRPYRKSMSLPMSPIGGARERLDSLNFEFLLSPLKMDLDQQVDPGTLFEDISLRNDFNLIGYVGNDAVESPCPEVVQMAPQVTVTEETLIVAKQQQQLKETAPTPPVKSLSRGKCLDLLRATHERQENLVKRCVAIDNQKRGVTKNLFASETVSVNKSTSGKNENVSVKKFGSKMEDISLKTDPNWSPTMEERGKKSSKTVSSASTKSKDKAISSNHSQPANNAKPNLVSGGGQTNLNYLKRRFLVNIPMISSAPRRKNIKVVRTDVPIVPSDHDYCSPIKRSVPMARQTKHTKTAIMIEDAAMEAKSPKKLLDIITQRKTAAVKSEAVTIEEKKRAINLEDYKRMRNGSAVIKPVLAVSPIVPVPKEYVDPISEAKNKALRLQERRKAARMKQVEVKLNTTPLVPILPLAVMAGLTTEETYNAEFKGQTTVKTVNFDEIMIVSVGCNTNVTIRPDYKSLVGDVSQSSTALLTNLSNRMRSKNPISSNSLLFSIQDVVIKKAVPPNFYPQKSPDSGVSAAVHYSPGKPEGAYEGVKNDHGYHHGEDKVIMHLRKDRIRPKTCTVSCQTDFSPEFPELQRLANNKRHYRRKSVSVASMRSSDSDSEASHSSESYSSYCESEDEYGRSTKRRRMYSNRSWSQSRSRSRSHSSYSCRRSKSPRARRSQSRYRSKSPRRLCNRISRSRSRSSRSRSRSCSRSGYNRNNDDKRWIRGRNRSPVEERRIVYVGRLEQDLTKDDLRRKFISYGSVRMITLHEKGNGTRYGFVTFDDAADAFKAIETARNNPIIDMYDVSFGGRRAFCGSSYADLDNIETEEDHYGVAAPIASSSNRDEESFESLLKSFKKKVMAVGP